MIDTLLQVKSNPQTGCFDIGTGFNSFAPTGGTISTPLMYEVKINSSDGGIFVGGGFNNFNGNPIPQSNVTNNTGLIKLTSTGQVDKSFVNYGFGYTSSVWSELNGVIRTIEVNNDGTIFVGGLFESYSGVSRNKFAKLNADGTLNTSFNIGTGFNSEVYDIEVQSDGKILIGGSNTSYSGISTSRICRLNTTGTLDTTFTGTTNGGVIDIDIQSDGKIICGGDFTQQNGTSKNRICRFNTDGSIDTSFNIGTGFNARVNVVKLQSDGKILCGGIFSSFNGTSVTIGMCRLNSDGTLDTSFTAAVTRARDIKLQSTGKILVLCDIGAIRLNTNGTLDSTFFNGIGDNIGGAFVGVAESIAVANDDSFYASSIFNYNGQEVGGVVKCYSNGTQQNCPQGESLYLDLYDDVSVNLNMSFAEIQDITSKNSGYSQTFKIPGTPKNSRFFNYAFDVNSSALSFDINQSVQCSINYKGNTVLDGILRLLNVYVYENYVEYEVNIQDEVGVFINDISNKLLVDLDYSDLNHTYSATNVTSSWTASYTGGTTTGGLCSGSILYPFQHIGYLYDNNGNVITSGSNASPILELLGVTGSISNSTTPMRTSGFKPSIQIYDVVDRIFTQNGYNIESNFFGEEYFQRLYMPLLFNSENYFINTTGGTNGSSQVRFLTDITPQGWDVQSNPCGGGGSYLDIWGDVQFDTFNYNDGPIYPTTGWDFGSHKFYAWAGGVYEFTFSIRLRVPNPGAVQNASGTGFLSKNHAKTGPNIFSSFAWSIDYTMGETETTIITGQASVTMAPGDYVSLVILSLYDVADCINPIDSLVPYVVAADTVMTVVQGPNLVIGSTLDIKEQISPEYKQLDFLKGLVTQFNLVFVKHPFKKNTYIMEPYEDYVGEGDTLDWTNKLDMSKPIKISPLTNLIGKPINFLNDEDADGINIYTKSLNNNRNFGTLNFIPSGVTINDSPLEFKSFFSSSPINYLPSLNYNKPLLCPHFYGVKETTVSGTTKTQLLPMKIKPRILHYKGLQDLSADWYFFNEVDASTTTYTQYPLLHHQDDAPSTVANQQIDLNFGNSSSPQDAVAPSYTNNTAYELYYAAMIEDLLSPDARMVTAFFDLTVEDIVNLEYKDIIFVKDAHYRINKISNFNLINNQPTQVELVKLLRIDYDYIPPTATPTPSPTPTLTPTPTPTATVTPTPTATPTNTPTVTPTPTVTNTPTPTPTNTPVPPPCVCVELTVTGTTAPEEGFAGSIDYIDCNGVNVAEAFTTPGTRYRCINYTGNIIQINSSTNIVYGIAAGVSCSNGTCPTGTTITCICYEYINETEGSLTIDYVACDGSQPIIGVPGGASGNFCARIGQYTGDTGLFITTCTPTIYCQDGFAICDNCGATPTPTPTSTNTPTPTPTVTNTPTPTPTSTPIVYNQFALAYSANNCGEACDNYANPSNRVTYYSTCNPLVNGCIIYSSTSPLTVATNGYYSDGTNCYQVLAGSGLIAVTTACPTPTPTPTITPTPTNTFTPTPTPTFPPCVTQVTFDVDVAGDVRYTDCCGITYYITYGIGPQVINDCIEYGSVFGVGATISFVTYNNTACVCPPTPTPTLTATPTPTPTATSTPTVTPTPTETPVPPAYNYYTFTPCNGGGGTDYRSILSLALGDVYTFLPYGPMEPDRACYEITDINAPANTNDLPTIYGPVQDDCGSEYCQQL